ncbi:MAG: alpha/beta fold hydrolase [Methylovulum sp.]|nr:alpha/beta fold hydrolase [Methylovulum sp.]
MELFAFPFAGGGEHCYRELGPYLHHAVLRTQAIPGRGRLIGQPCIRRIDGMVDYLLAQLAPELGQPYALFGHSMGAFVAYMLTRKIIAHHLPPPKVLIFSGRKAPTVVDPEPKHKLPDELFRKMLQDLGGIPDVVWQDSELMALFEPIIRADFELIETCLYTQCEPVNIPIHLLMGKEDKVTRAEAEAWQKESTQPLSITYFDGGHFYFQDDWQALAGKINAVLATLEQP